jgi:hypothetical protein
LIVEGDMKKIFILKMSAFLFVAVILAFGVFAQNSGNLTGGLGGNLSGVGEGLKDTAGDVFQKEVVLPGWLDTASKIFFGLDEGGLKFNRLIILLVLWIFFFMFALEILKFTAFESKWVRIVIGLAATMIFSVFGILNRVVGFILDFRGWIAFVVVLAIVIALVVFKILSRSALKRRELERLETEGVNAGIGLKTLGSVSEVAKKINKK